MLLKARAKKLLKEMGAEKARVVTVKTVYEHAQGEHSWQEFLLRSLVRPFALFVQEPIIQLFGAYMAFVYGNLYRVYVILGTCAIHSTSYIVVFTTLPRIFTEVYQQRIGIVGLHYISLVSAFN